MSSLAILTDHGQNRGKNNRTKDRTAELRNGPVSPKYSIIGWLHVKYTVNVM